jgi:hypothetical protein
VSFFPHPYTHTHTQIRRVLETECGVALDPAGLYTVAPQDTDTSSLPLLLPYTKLSPVEPEEPEGDEGRRAGAAREALGEMAMTPSLARLVRCVIQSVDGVDFPSLLLTTPHTKQTKTPFVVLPIPQSPLTTQKHI